MRGMPPLQLYNRFSCLTVDECEDDEPLCLPELVMPKEEVQKVKQKKWERKLPKEWVLAVMPSSKSFQIWVEIQTTNTQEIKGARALLDCRASGLFVDKGYMA